MPYILLANTKFMRYLKILNESARTLAATVLLAAALTANALTQVSGGWDDTGNDQYGSGPYSSPLKPSIGQPGYEQLRRQQERQGLQSSQDRLQRATMTKLRQHLQVVNP